MGCVANVSHDKFPKQGSYAGREVNVLFNYQDPVLHGVMVRDDMEEPFVQIIKLDDGRHVLTTECQWQPR